MFTDFETISLQKVAQNEGFIDFKIEPTFGTKRGDNFLGVINAVTVSGSREQNGTRKQDALYLICKSPPSSEFWKKKLNISSLFEREIYMYTKVLPAFVRFQRERGLSETESFLAFPKVYMCEVSEETDSYILIMEDVRVNNFVMWPKEELISLDHELLILREMAKLHAISFAMKDQQPNEFDDFKKLHDVHYKAVIDSRKKWFVTLIDRVINGLDRLDHKNHMEKFRENCAKKMEYLLLELPRTETSVILHGDCWNNNFLFQYSGKNVSLSNQYYK